MLGPDDDSMSVKHPSEVKTAPNRGSVSVIIPCYRCAQTIRRAVSSVAGQSLLPAELILVDDASGDGTLHELRELQHSFRENWIKVILLQRNLGAGSARNAGWDAASCKYIAFLDADDAWHPRKIEIQHAFMEAHPEMALSGHAHRRITDGDPVGGALMHQGFRLISRWELLLSNRFVTPSIMLRRDSPYRFRAGQRHMEDHLLWLEIASDGARTVRLNEVLVFTYKAPVGYSGLSAQRWKMRRAELSNFWYLHRTERLGLVPTITLCAYSLMKHVRSALLHVGEAIGGQP
ncbi:MAG TPA: glycosyltransferase family 2 protein [Burkholderiales bacterium]|nr:glycosyltransferase family 2 protein [Burkholderiales bacterium]